MKRIFQLMFVFLALGVQAQVKFVKTVNTVNDLQNLQPDDIHDVVFVKGYASAAAADGAKFVYDATSAAATNTVNVFKPVSVSGNGRWLRQDPVFQAGSTTVPSITFGLDPNTGFANSASDQIDIITGGTRKGYVDSAGSLRLTAGVASSSTTTGTAIITGGLGVSGAANVGGVTSVTDTTEATTGGAGALKTSGGLYVAKKAVVNTDLIVNTSLVYADSAAGKVGIGTTGPDRKLDILDASNPQIRLTQTDGTVFTDIQTITGGHTLTTNTFGARTTSTTVNDTSVLARQVQGGLAFDGVTNAKDLHTIGADIGTSDFSLTLTILVPSSNPSGNVGLFNISSSSTTAAVANRIYGYLASDGSLNISTRDSGVNEIYATVSGLVSAYGGKIATITMVRVTAASSLSIYFNGVQQTVAASGSGTTWANSIISTYAYFGQYDSTHLYQGTIFSATLFNRALSASEVVTLANRGVQEADKWGTLTSTFYTGSFAAGTDLWATDPSRTATAPTAANADGAGVPPSNDWLKVSNGASTQSIYIYRSSGFTALIGKRVRMTADIFVPAGSPVSYVVLAGTVSTGITGVTKTAPITVTAGTTTTVSGDFEFRDYGMIRVTDSAGTTISVASGNSIYVKNLTLTKVGCILDADLSAGVGYQVPDRSSNKYHGTVSTSGTSWTRPERYGQLRATSNTLGNQWLLGQQTIPLNATIRQITAYTTGTPTVYVGSTAANNQHVAAVALTASTYNVLTLLQKFTSGNIHINSTTGDTINWVVDYALSDY